MLLRTPTTSATLICSGIFVLVSFTSSAEDKSIVTGRLKTFNQEFVAITPGEGKFPKSFKMGLNLGPKNEVPEHEVTLNQAFSIAKYEVPQNLYEAVMGVNPSKWKGPRNSCEMMTLAEAQEFCRKATQLMRTAKLILDNEEIRLPSEAEWEYCCRAGTTTKYSFGDEATKPEDQAKQASILSDYAWHTGNAAGNDPPVGAKKPNAWGLYDMHGYLSEFVGDAWHDNYKGAPTDGSVWSSDDAKAPLVIRSGSWKDEFPQLTSTARRKIGRDEVGDEIGFRCVKAEVKKAP